MATEVIIDVETVARISVRGDLDGSVTDRLLEAYGSSAGAAVRDVVLDLTDVGYLDSSGLAAIVGLLGRVRADHRTLRVAGLTPHFREIFAITRLDDHVIVESDHVPVAQSRSAP